MQFSLFWSFFPLNLHFYFFLFSPAIIFNPEESEGKIDDWVQGATLIFQKIRNNYGRGQEGLRPHMFFLPLKIRIRIYLSDRSGLSLSDWLRNTVLSHLFYLGRVCVPCSGNSRQPDIHHQSGWRASARTHAKLPDLVSTIICSGRWGVANRTCLGFWPCFR